MQEQRQPAGAAVLETCMYMERSSARDTMSYLHIERSSARDVYLYREEQCSRHVSIQTGVVLEAHIYMERSSARDIMRSHAGLLIRH